ncbi:hypothetical protein WN51_11267 [Melipona quadrifasciata]|uniref:DUF5641 domain-containing protein n=1 Tax=Melipona quadrifasciata TaxID=166423 RepID=A0A0N0BBL6_9HYME|nr:hypothetical protein WN51_11267 [Melipona quadrifasciata]
MKKITVFLKANHQVIETRGHRRCRLAFYSPHFGGLWERSIRSAKQHLLRVVEETRLTFDELYTVLTQVEPCMNSRPLHPLSSDPADLNPLTPVHFLIGRPLIALPHPDVTDVKTNRLSRSQLLQAMQRDFWKRWQANYLHQLQQRHKWKSSTLEHFGVGTMVVLKGEKLPTLRWKLGRITAPHLEKDGIARVLSVGTADGLVRHPMAGECILPMDEGGGPAEN